MRFLISPFALLVISLLILRFAPLPSATRGSTFVAALIVAAVAAAVAAGLAMLRRRYVTRWRNHTLKQRIFNFVDLMNIARQSVVLVTGSLHHNLYDQDDVVRAIEDLDDCVTITVCHEDELDPRSARFLAALKRSGAIFKRIYPDRISHGAVIDSKHCKIEQFGVDDADADKRIDYYAYDRKRAKRALNEIEAAVMDENETNRVAA